MLLLSRGRPWSVAAAPRRVIPGSVSVVAFAVFVVALFLAAVDSLRTIVTMSPTRRATGFSNKATSRPTWYIAPLLAGVDGSMAQLSCGSSFGGFGVWQPVT